MVDPQVVWHMYIFINTHPFPGFSYSERKLGEEMVPSEAGQPLPEFYC